MVLSASHIAALNNIQFPRQGIEQIASIGAIKTGDIVRAALEKMTADAFNLFDIHNDLTQARLACYKGYDATINVALQKCVAKMKAVEKIEPILAGKIKKAILQEIFELDTANALLLLHAWKDCHSSLSTIPKDMIHEIVKASLCLPSGNR